VIDHRKSHFENITVLHAYAIQLLIVYMQRAHTSYKVYYTKYGTECTSSRLLNKLKALGQPILKLHQQLLNIIINVPIQRKCIQCSKYQQEWNNTYILREFLVHGTTTLQLHVCMFLQVHQMPVLNQSPPV
jgi:hypothetical protein